MIQIIFLFVCLFVSPFTSQLYKNAVEHAPWTASKHLYIVCVTRMKVDHVEMIARQGSLTTYWVAAVNLQEVLNQKRFQVKPFLTFVDIVQSRLDIKKYITYSC